MLAVARARSDGNQFGLYTGCFLNIFSGADFPCWRGPVLVRADNLRRFCHVSALDFGRIDFAVSLLTPWCWHPHFRLPVRTHLGMRGMRGQTGVAPFLLPMWEHDNFPAETSRRFRREFNPFLIVSAHGPLR